MRKVLMVLCLLVSVCGCLSSAAAEDPSDTHGANTSVTHAYVQLEVTNEPPKITSLRLSPATAYDDTDLECVASSIDREQDRTDYHYSWSRNGELVGFDQKVLPHQYFVARDVVACEATPFDIYGVGESATTSAMVNEVALATKIVKTSLQAVGVRAGTPEVSAVTQKGLAATTGFVVNEVGQSGVSGISLLVFVAGFLVVVNLNLLLRLRKSLKQRHAV
jgi:hypothetical protein